jgi:hypothetical protein
MASQPDERENREVIRSQDGHLVILGSTHRPIS